MSGHRPRKLRDPLGVTRLGLRVPIQRIRSTPARAHRRPCAPRGRPSLERAESLETHAATRICGRSWGVSSLRRPRVVPRRCCRAHGEKRSLPPQKQAAEGRQVRQAPWSPASPPGRPAPECMARPWSLVSYAKGIATGRSSPSASGAGGALSSGLVGTRRWPATERAEAIPRRASPPAQDGRIVRWVLREKTRSRRERAPLRTSLRVTQTPGAG